MMLERSVRRLKTDNRRVRRLVRTFESWRRPARALRVTMPGHRHPTAPG